MKDVNEMPSAGQQLASLEPLADEDMDLSGIPEITDRDNQGQILQAGD